MALEADKTEYLSYDTHDKQLLSEMFHKVDPVGNYEYFSQLRYSKKIEKRVGQILLDYAPQFNDHGIKVTIVQIISDCKLYDRAEDILSIFYSLSEKEKYCQDIFFDNALSRISNDNNDVIFLKKLTDRDVAWHFPLTIRKMTQKYPDKMSPIIFSYPLHHSERLDALIINCLFKLKTPKAISILQSFISSSCPEHTKQLAKEKIRKLTNKN